MLTYNNTIHLSFLFAGDSQLHKQAKDVLAPGNLVRAKSNFLALKIPEARPGIGYDDWGNSEVGTKHYYHFTPERTVLIIKEPTWCQCPRHFTRFSKSFEWVENHLGYASLIFLHGEQLYEALTAIQKDDGMGKDLLQHTTEEYLREHPELVFIPLIESAKP